MVFIKNNFRRAKERKITKRKAECDETNERENDGSTSPVSAISGLQLFFNYITFMIFALNLFYRSFKRPQTGAALRLHYSVTPVLYSIQYNKL